MKVPKNYYNYFDVCKWEGVPTNTAKSATERGLEGIAAIEKLKPIGHQFKLFPKYENGTLRNAYGILKSDYEYYKKHGRARRKSPGRPPRWKNDPAYFNINIPIKKALWDRFKRMVDNANAVSTMQITYRDMLYVALEEAILRRPQFAGGGDDGKQD